MVSCAIVLEVTGFEVSEMAKFGQLDMLDFPCVSMDGLVKVDDLGVRKGKGSEKLKDVLKVLLQLLSPMGEGAENGGCSGVPSDGPISIRLDSLGRFPATNGEVKVSDRGGGLVFSESGKQSREDNVKVDRRSGEDMLPLGSWKRWE
jgi:hypothetical protein